MCSKSLESGVRVPLRGHEVTVESKVTARNMSEPSQSSWGSYFDSTNLFLCHVVGELLHSYWESWALIHSSL